ncbi:MAG: N-acetylmuramoyl-L-alanine amidase [Elusimicrobia bacterium]|nr:N-acetylmuramoyl-L-alanine amidase [Elusimicrobiota bacterium]
MFRNLKYKIIFLFLFFTFANARISKIEVKIIENGKFCGSVNLLLVNGMGYVKTMDVANLFYLKAEWLPDKKCVRLLNNKNDAIELFIKSKKLYIKKRLFTLKKDPIIFEGSSWIPLELIVSRSFQSFVSAKVRWNFAKKILEIKREKIALKKKKRIPQFRTRYEKKYRKVTKIVIDPGHGGKDPGAIGYDGTKEKNIVLDIALRLYKLLARDSRFSPILTRKTDVFLPLATRALIAERANADLFVSIHVNASYNKYTKGFEAYFLSDVASDEEAQKVANFENAVVELEEGTTYKTDVNSILWSMRLNEFMNESSEFCGILNSKIKNIIKTRGIKQAGFYVLKGVKRPAALLEIGFITNKGDLRKLKSAKFRQKIARAIYEAIVSYKQWSEKN